MKNISTRNLVNIAMVAAIYVVITYTFSFMSYKEIQFRISEVMVLLVFIDPLYFPGLVLGTFIANLIGPYGLPDAIIGSIHSFISIFMIIKTSRFIKDRTRSLFIASLLPGIFSFIIAGEIYYFTGVKDLSVFWLAYLTVAIGELVVITGIGFPLFKYIYTKPNWIKMLKIKS